MYHDPEILIFDEATSSLDSKTESMITKEIMQLSEERTMIFISHRINTLKGCNTIYSLENGYIRVIDDIDNITRKNFIKLILVITLMNHSKTI